MEIFVEILNYNQQIQANRAAHDRAQPGEQGSFALIYSLQERSDFNTALKSMKRGNIGTILLFIRIVL